MWTMDGQVLEGLQVPACGEPCHYGEADGRADTAAGCCAHGVKVRLNPSAIVWR